MNRIEIAEWGKQWEQIDANIRGVWERFVAGEFADKTRLGERATKNSSVTGWSFFSDEKDVGFEIDWDESWSHGGYTNGTVFMSAEFLGFNQDEYNSWLKLKIFEAEENAQKAADERVESARQKRLTDYEKLKAEFGGEYA